METYLRHPNEDVLEEYALDRLGEPEVALLEEHLLVCEQCQSKLQEIDDFVLAMRQAGPEFTPAAGLRGWWARFPGSLGSWLALTARRAALAGVMAVLGIVAIVERPRNPDGPPVAVTLQALRGGGRGYTATAPAGRPLALAIEVPDLAACAQCRVEMVSDSGRTAWSGSAAITGGRLAITAPVALGSGVYWIRLYTGGPGPAREFGLRLE